MTQGPAQTMPRLLTIDEAGDYLGLTRDTVRKYLKAGTLPGVQIGRKWFVNAGQLAEHLGGAA